MEIPPCGITDGPLERKGLLVGNSIMVEKYGRSAEGEIMMKNDQIQRAVPPIAIVKSGMRDELCAAEL